MARHFISRVPVKKEIFERAKAVSAYFKEPITKTLRTQIIDVVNRAYDKLPDEAKIKNE